MSDACIHHWMLPAPNGTTSVGKCNKCGEVKTFLNWDVKKEGSPWRRTTQGTWKSKEARL